MSGSSRSVAFRQSILDIANNLNQQDIQSLCFLNRDKIYKQCTCRSQNGIECISCPVHLGMTGVTLLEQLLERGVYSERNTGPLTDLLQRAGRVDLARTFEETFVKRFAICEPPSPPLDESPYSRGFSLGFKPVSPVNGDMSPPPTLLNEATSPHLDPNLEVDSGGSYTPTHHIRDNLCDGVRVSPSHIPHTPSHNYNPTTVHSLNHQAEQAVKYRNTKLSRQENVSYEEETPTTPRSHDNHCTCCTQRPRANTDIESVRHEETQSLPSSALRRHTDWVEGERLCQSEQLELSHVARIDISHTDGDSDCSTSEEYAVILNKKELEELTETARQTQTSTVGIIKKLENAKPTKKLQNLDESFHIIEERISVHKLPDQINNQPPPRTFSLPTLRPRRKKLPTQFSAPEVTQSCENLPERKRSSMRTPCRCQGACFRSPDRDSKSPVAKRRPLAKEDSGDSGDSGRCSQNSTENLNKLGEQQVAKQVSLHSAMIKDEDGVELCEWKLSRCDICMSIINHKNNCFEKRVHVKKSNPKKSINLSLKLYPDGLDREKGNSLSLALSITGNSDPKSNLFLDCTFRAFDAQSDSLIATRDRRLPVAEKSLVIEDFLPHAIIKQSSAKAFRFTFKFHLQMSVNREWIVVENSMSVI